MAKMDKRKEKDGWVPAPPFGGRDHTAPGATDYSMVFSRAHAKRKQHKTEIKHCSLGNELELIAATRQQEDSVTKDGWMPTPQFGGWKHTAPGATNYSVEFSRARANRKQHKTQIKHCSLGNEQELVAATHQQDNSVMKDGWMPTPQFGGWDHTAPGATDYSMVFSRACANRKQHKTQIKHFSLGNEQELIASTRQQDDSVKKRKTFLTYINRCIRP